MSKLVADAMLAQRVSSMSSISLVSEYPLAAMVTCSQTVRPSYRSLCGNSEVALIAFERAQYILEKKGITHMQEVNELRDMMKRIVMPDGNGATRQRSCI